MHSPSNETELDLLVGRMKAAAAPLREVLNEMHARYATCDAGKVADYIPELAKADRRWFGIAIATTDGQVFEVGDSKQLFTIQSISKPFVYGLALEDRGLEQVLGRVGVEPTGEAFNAIVLDEVSNRPFNPMVNAGAIATTDLINGKDYPERVSRLLAMFGRYCGRDVYIDNSVFMSERMTGHRNRAIGQSDAQLRDGRRTDRRVAGALFPTVFGAGELPRPGGHRSDTGQCGCESAHRPTGDRAALREVPAQHHALLRDVRLCGRMGLSRGDSVQERRRRRHRGSSSRAIRDRRLLSTPGRQGKQCPRHPSLPGAFGPLRPAHL